MILTLNFVDPGCFNNPTGPGQICREYFANIAFLNKQKML